MAKNIRKLLADLDKNLKALDEVSPLALQNLA